MEDLVPFKVFTYWNGDEKPEVRRFGIEKSVVTSFHYLNAKLQEAFPGLKNKCYNVSWKGKCLYSLLLTLLFEIHKTSLQYIIGNVIKTENLIYFILYSFINTIILHIIDEEGDDVTVSSDNELMIALVAMQTQNLMKLYIYCKDQKPQNEECDIVLTAVTNNVSNNGE